ncbi:HupE/UreJ protein [Aquimarina sp. MAR_2010_214]|uniref:HupE/UreJ family protein n=1 Tax=Aquimarina sp. MAR_2010_214 TaxID=1250026 RepID=UPI000C70DBDF|nr:HupE/UreJ family protein [Aquimarina sp. MAR_2010_214]PKV48041.1 HupE/UreJ protein [Aquimarina sp. MAR_2010_214]
MLMRFLKTLIFCAFLCSSSVVFSHPEDELVILEIELGELDFLDKGITAEYELIAAIKRQRMRKLEAMPWQEKFLLFIKAGVEHIIPKGLDHILFVLGLFFSSLILGRLLWQVTAFTLAHTITLALAAFGFVQAPIDIVEPLIALSIVWVAVENCVFKQTNKWRPFIVFSFGLLHGLGFATVLSEYGLPKNNFIPSLLAFNIGVEIGQLLVLVTASALVWFIRHKSWYRRRIQIPASLMIALVGLFWFIERVL